MATKETLRLKCKACTIARELVRKLFWVAMNVLNTFLITFTFVTEYGSSAYTLLIETSI